MIISEKAKDALSKFKLPENIGFGSVMSPVMAECDYKDGKWGTPKISAYGPLFLDPTTKVLHYGQEIFEGMKAYKVDGKGPYLFRPDKNFHRFNHSARRMAMAEVPEEILYEMSLAVQKLAVAIKEGVNADGINIAMNNDAPAGQVIFHAHMHIIPRYKDDGFKHWKGTPYKDEKEAQNTAESIIEKLR